MEQGKWNDFSGETAFPFVVQWSLFKCKLNEHLPAVIVAGQTLENAVLGEPAGALVELAADSERPKGLALSKDGKLSWKTTDADAGRYRLRFTISKDGLFTCMSHSLNVVSKELAAKVGGDLSKLGEIGRFVLSGAQQTMEYTCDMNGLVVLDDKMAIILDSDGQLVLEKIKLEKTYKRLFARATTLVALSDATLDVLDRKTGKEIRAIDLKAAKTIDLAVDPTQQVCWVAIFEPGMRPEEKLAGYRVVRVDETAGTFKKFDSLYGNMVRIHPNGKMLFTALKEVLGEYTRIVGVHGPIATIDNTENVDLLMSYDITQGSVRLRQTNKAPGANGQNLRISPDGRFISYASAGGYRSGTEQMNGYTIPAFPVEDIRMAKVAYNIGPYPYNIAYHPQIPLVACWVGGFFDRDSGKKFEELKADFLGETKFDDATSYLFSPSGRNFVACYKDSQSCRVLRAFPLILSASERAVIGRKVDVFEPTKPATPKVGVKLGDLDTLGTRPSVKAMEPKEVARAFKTSVVVIESNESSGTGFFVGAKGFIVTCAHVLPENGDFQVKYLVEKGGGVLSITAKKAEVAAIDREQDIALIRVDVPDAVKTVNFSRSNCEMGQKVTIIGNPGKGQQVLDYTLTAGVISNPARDVDGRPFIQTDASVNPGSSGSPIFDDTGNVIGMVVLKARLEGVGFGVPVGRIRGFLEGAGKP